MRKPSWTYCTSVYLPKKHCTVFRDESLGVQLQVEVRREWTLFPPKERSYFFIDGVERVFRSEDRMVRALQRARAGDAHQAHPRPGSRISFSGRRGLPSHG
jgi:hypothetical protein